MKEPLLVTMSGPSTSPTLGEYLLLDDFTAGVVALKLLGQAYPGLRFSDLPVIARERNLRNERGALSGWLTDATRAVGKVARAAGSVVVAPVEYAKDTVADVFGFSGQAVGDAVRLVTDEKVVDGAATLYKSFNEGGGVAGVFGGEKASGGLSDFISGIGNVFKGKVAEGANEAGMFGGGSVLPWAIAGSAVLLVLFARPGAAPAYAPAPARGRR